MDNSELLHRVLSTLQRHGVSECEGAVLSIVRYRIPLPPDGIAGYAKCYEQYQDSIGAHSLAEYLRAVDTCIEKGWLTILPTDYFELEAQRGSLLPIPEVVDRCYGPGSVDYTEAGFLFHRLLQREMYGPEWLEQEEYAGWNWDVARSTIDIYATAEEGCVSLLEEIKKNLAAYLSRPAKVAAVEAVRPIGPWKPDRFLTVLCGFHAVLKVELPASARPRGREGDDERANAGADRA